jgi:hypothetical protein
LSSDDFTMFKWLWKKWFPPRLSKVEWKIDLDTPCWRCFQVIEGGALKEHNCQHGYNCVMLGWQCMKCRILCSMRRGVCYLRCKDEDCAHIKEALARHAAGEEPFEGFNNFTSCRK